MFFRTHFVVALFFVLVFLQYIENPIIFLPVAFIATILPDIDSRFSRIGHHKIFRIFNFFVRHRGITHSFSFLAMISLLIFFSFRGILLPFTSAYSLHLLLDSLTVSGIMPFYPLKFRIKGKIKTGGIIERVIFVSFLLIDFLLMFFKIYLISK
jgi:membrane-bound metal-dependent hydrolase YbcI (DUF457 family)